MANLILKPLGPRIQDWTAEKIGRLTVIEYAGCSSKRHYYWKCRCDCGNECVIRADALRTEHTTSCGCFHLERLKKRPTKHGMYRTKLYRIWADMKTRCLNPNNKAYHLYGGAGRGLQEQRWHVFENWNEDMGATYEPGLTLERIDNEKGYSKANCKWATRSDQANNTRQCVWVTIEGSRRTLTQWAYHYGVSRKAVEGRRHRGWPIEQWFIPLVPKHRKAFEPLG